MSEKKTTGKPPTEKAAMICLTSEKVNTKTGVIDWSFRITLNNTSAKSINDLLDNLTTCESIIAKSIKQPNK